MSRWHEECLGRCEDCIKATPGCTNPDNAYHDPYKSCRFVSVGPVRYGMRVGAGSPPPPGAGPRYRSQSCWPAALLGDGDGDQLPPLSLTARPKNNVDIIRTRLRIADEASSDDQLAVTRVRDHVLLSRKLRCPLGRPQGYVGETTLDRLPRFRFGGNRAAADRRHKELADRLRRNAAVPVPPPRTKHSRTTPPQSPTASIDIGSPANPAPLRSASFSQVDYCIDDNKYVRRKLSTPDQEPEPAKEVSTLPRPKNSSRPTTPKLDVPTSRPAPEARPTADISEETEPTNDIPEVEITPGSPDKPAPRLQDLPTSSGKKREKSRRRKGIYISQWPNNYNSTEDVIPQFVEDGDFPSAAAETAKSLKESLAGLSKLREKAPMWSSPQEEPLSPEDASLPPEWPRAAARGVSLFRSGSLSEGDQASLVPSDLSDSESRVSLSAEPASPSVPRRYSKRPLRGPYGQMLENEMKKPDCRKNLNEDLQFLEDLSCSASVSLNNISQGKYSRTRASTDGVSKEEGIDHVFLSSPKQMNKRKVSADNLVVCGADDGKLVVNHQRTTSSPSKLEVFSNPEVNGELLERLLRGSSEQLAASDVQRYNDTRTHVVVELYDNEKSYVESLRILVTKYLEPLKTPENANLLDANLVDEIFYQIPFLYNHHQAFLIELKKRLEQWGEKQKIGDIILDMFSKAAVIDSYTNYVNNWKKARDIWKNAQQKPAFSKFVEATARQNARKLTLDSLLIKPIQRFPKYELILERLIKHTDEHHPDHNFLLTAHQQVHEQLLKINCTERETLELEHLREIEGLIDGLIELATPDRQYLRHDLVSMSHGNGPRKERALFLFSDILLITGIKRRSGTVKRPAPGQGTLEANKYKLLMKIPLEDIDIVRSKDDNLKQILREVDNLTDDISVLNQMNELAWSLHCNHAQLDEVLREMLASANKQLAEQQNSDAQLACLDLTIAIPNGSESVAIIFSKTEKRTSWEESLSEAKQKLALTTDRRPSPELLATVPIRKTRAGLQFTCAAPTLGENGKDVWVCNSDGYVGQVCVLSLTPEPTVISCNGVCNARILCIASVPGVNNGSPNRGCQEKEEPERPKSMHFDSSSSSEDEDNCDNELNEESQRVFDFETCIDDNEETDTQQSTMWLGTEDGCIHVYNCCDNIRIKKNKVKLQLGTPIFSIIYLENRVFAALANGELIIYSRDSTGGWNISNPTTCTVGSASSPVTKLVPNMGSIWCACGNYVKTFNINTLTTDNAFSVNDNKTITGMVICGNGVWLSLQNSAIVRCHHSATFDLLCEINVAPAVTKMLTSCDDIIRQHKAACLRVTSLVTCKDLVWIGTSAGVLLTMPLPHISSTATKLTNLPSVVGVPHGHTGHVRFLTSIEMVSASAGETVHRNSYKAKQEPRSHAKMLVISGGDGYEDFRTSNLSEVAGREDSTNHLLLWNI